MQYTRKSQLTGIHHTLDLNITNEQLDRFYSGEAVQKVFPHLPAHEREFILTGITKEEWDEQFGTTD
jgi:uroporphyrinogen-III synthase